MSSEGLVSEEAVVAGKRADHKARNRAMLKASDSVSIQDDAVRAVLAAAAPLIVADDRARLADELGRQGTRRHHSAGENKTAALLAVFELLIAARLRRRASMLREVNR